MEFIDKEELIKAISSFRTDGPATDLLSIELFEDLMDQCTIPKKQTADAFALVHADGTIHPYHVKAYRRQVQESFMKSFSSSPLPKYKKWRFWYSMGKRIVRVKVVRV